MTDFGIDYAAQVREDHALFVDAFREGADRDHGDLSAASRARALA